MRRTALLKRLKAIAKKGDSALEFTREGILKSAQQEVSSDDD